ncbi:MAG: TetR family transcriptional regulator C-terminal domain-containing protein [Gammaproteobacteria bacterium]
MLDHGVRLLMDQGYHGTGIKEILDAVKIPKGSFYNYFASKEDFGAAAVRHYIEPFIRQIETDLALHEDDALAGLNSYYSRLIEEAEAGGYQGGCLLGNLLGEIGDTSDICLKALKQAVDDYSSALAVGLRKAQLQGRLREDLTHRQMADLLTNAWQGALLRMKIERSSLPLKQCVDSLLNGYFGRTPGRRPKTTPEIT